jgi:2-aminoadipate transaminase
MEDAFEDVRLSRYGRASVTPAPVAQMMAAFSSGFRDGVDINLGVGYVNEKTIPTDLFGEALEAVCRDPGKYRQAFNYGPPAGSANLVDSLRRFLVGHRVGGLDEATLRSKRILIGPCGATSVLGALADVFAPGIVVTADPLYYIYCDALERKGFELLSVPEDEEGICVEALEERLAGLGERAREVSFFYVITVNNPSGTILSNRRRRAVLEAATRFSRAQRRRVPVFFDLAYELLLHDPEAEPFESVFTGGQDELGLACEIGTLSKVLAPGLRLGYIIGPPGPLMDALVQNATDVGLGAPLFVQEMASYLLDRHIDGQLARVKAGYREKAVAVKQGIDRELGPALEDCRGGRAGFYFYLTFRELQTHPASRLFRILTRTTGDPRLDGPADNPLPRVIYIPGQYCVHPKGALAEAGKRQLRLSYGFEEPEAILRALRLIREAGEEAS